jgi:hypothetical protein
MDLLVKLSQVLIEKENLSGAEVDEIMSEVTSAAAEGVIPQ